MLEKILNQKSEMMKSIYFCLLGLVFSFHVQADVCFGFGLDFDVVECGEVCISVVAVECDTNHNFIDAQAEFTLDGVSYNLGYEGEPVCVELVTWKTYSITINYTLTHSSDNPTHITQSIHYTMGIGDPPVASFNIVDESLNTSSSFCYGEPVLFQNTGTEDEEEWYIQICQRNIGDPTENYPCLNWTSNKINNVDWQQGEVPNQLDLLKDVWQFHHSQWQFWEGYQYTVTLAINNNPCYQWVDDVNTFVVDPCFIENLGFHKLTPLINNWVIAVPNNPSTGGCIEEVSYCIDWGDDSPVDCYDGILWEEQHYYDLEADCENGEDMAHYYVCLSVQAIDLDTGEECSDVHCEDFYLSCTVPIQGLQIPNTAQNSTEGLSVFPNPAQTEINISIDIKSWGDQTIMRIFNAKGQLMKSEYVPTKHNIDVGFLSPGLYQIMLQDNNGNVVYEPFIKN